MIPSLYLFSCFFHLASCFLSLFSIRCLFSIFDYYLFYFVKRNQNSQVSTNLLYNLENLILLMLMPNKNPNIEIGSLLLLRFLMDYCNRLFYLKYQFFLYNSLIFNVHLDFYYHIFYCISFFYYV